MKVGILQEQATREEVLEADEEAASKQVMVEVASSRMEQVQEAILNLCSLAQ
jgi:hypothetical protein